MTAAAFTIFWMKIKLEWHSITFCSLGALFGMVFGLDVLDSLLDPPTKKLGFVCIWFSFAFALFLLNRYYLIGNEILNGLTNQTYCKFEYSEDGQVRVLQAADTATSVVGKVSAQAKGFQFHFNF